MIRKALLTSTAATPNVQAPQPQKPNMVLARPAARPREGAARQRRRPCQGTRRVTGGDEDADSDDDDEDADEGGGDGDLDSLVPDPQVCREFGVSAMTLWRWDRDPFLGAARARGERRHF
jgi:hypothetical protein